MRITATLAVLAAVLTGAARVYAQGYIVPNGVFTNLFAGEIDVWNPGTQVTGFTFTPVGKQQPTFYTNIFNFDEPLTIGVRVFLVSSNDPISLEPIRAHSYQELTHPANYVLQAGVPFYVGLYTGYNFAPPYPPYPPFYYTDPVFGWAKLVNNRGWIQVLDSAVAYKAQGILAGTVTIIPEPTVFALTMLGALLFACCRRRHAAWQA
jgi:hypothetical protein